MHNESETAWANDSYIIPGMLAKPMNVSQHKANLKQLLASYIQFLCEKLKSKSPKTTHR